MSAVGLQSSPCVGAIEIRPILGLYKELIDEIVPLSVFALRMYPETHETQPVLGSQGYDASVIDESGNEVDRIEMTVPHDGAGAVKDASRTVRRGYGQIQVGTPGDDFDGLFQHVLGTCQKKSYERLQGLLLGCGYRADAALGVIYGTL